MSRYTICYEHLDDGGYTRTGRYFGLGAPLWAVEDDNDGSVSYVRARTAHDAAKRIEVTDYAVHFEPSDMVLGMTDQLVFDQMHDEDHDGSPLTASRDLEKECRRIVNHVLGTCSTHIPTVWNSVSPYRLGVLIALTIVESGAGVWDGEIRDSVAATAIDEAIKPFSLETYVSKKKVMPYPRKPNKKGSK